MPTKEDGSCVNLVGNLCSIYDTRPDICRVKHDHAETAGVCRSLQAAEGLGLEWHPQLEAA